MAKKYADKNSIAFADYRAFLPLKIFHWPKMRIVKSPKLLAELHEEWDHCQACGRKFGPHYNASGPGWRAMQIHHIIGAAGRSDERTNLIGLCICGAGSEAGCHAEAHGGNLPLGRVLYLKWKSDPAGVDWIRLAILRGSFLPDLVAE